MSLCVSGFSDPILPRDITLTIPIHHPLIKLARSLPWDSLLTWITSDLQRTAKRQWWRGRPLKVRIHLGLYLLQQLYNYTDRQMEQLLKDNAAFQVFCGYGLVDEWHCPDHTKIEEFRSRLLPETQRRLANLIAQHAVKLGYANPAHVDIDSTVQEANISYPARANALVKLAALAKRLVEPLNSVLAQTSSALHAIDMKRIKGIAKQYFFARKASAERKLGTLKQLWREVSAQVMPVIKDSHLLIPMTALPRYTPIQRALEQLTWKGAQFLDNMFLNLFEGIVTPKPIWSFHAHAVSCFNKNKPHKKLEFGRAYQLGRMEGNFLWVGPCTSLRMPDAKSLPAMVQEHQGLFGENALYSIATDKAYYSHANHRFLQAIGVQEIGLQRPSRTLNVASESLPSDTLEPLYNRRSGIEALISHAKHGGQLGRSRMKSDSTTLSAGYTSILGFNLRQLLRIMA